MTVLTPEPTKNITEMLDELFSSARYLVDDQGSRTDVVLSLLAWEKLLTWLEDVDDRIIVQEWLPRLEAGPISSNALRWKDVAAEWDDNDSPLAIDQLPVIAEIENYKQKIVEFEAELTQLGETIVDSQSY